MKLRGRIFLAAVLLILVPLGALSWVLRQQVAQQFTRTFHERATAQLTAAVGSLLQRGERSAAAIDGIVAAMQDDNQLRLGIVGGRDDLLPHVRDAAGRAMRLGGLQVLQLQDERGTILSSGHYRNEFGRRESELPRLLRQSTWPVVDPGDGEPAAAPARIALARLRRPEGDVLALVTLRELSMGDRQLDLIGGEVVTPSTLAALAAGQASLSLRDAAGEPLLPAPPDEPVALVRTLEVPLIAGGALDGAVLVAQVSQAPLRRTLREFDLTLALALAVAIGGAFGLAAWLSARLSQPLQDLARQAARVDLDRPDTDLTSDRADEVGQLARVLGTMVTRLREDARRLADAEHRATLGEVARQVNHDLRNGLTPVRHVLRHLRETAAEDPARLGAVFRDREATLDGSLAYLEDLAGRYARIAPERRRERCDLAAIAREAALGYPEATVDADPAAPLVLGDPVALRRILDNLLRNAREAQRGPHGRTDVLIAPVDDPDLGRQCRLTVRDDGVGMQPEVLARVCEDFFTTKPGGTGLGLSNVRRLASDAGGHLSLASEPGAGTTVTITFPGAESDA